MPSFPKDLDTAQESSPHHRGLENKELSRKQSKYNVRNAASTKAAETTWPTSLTSPAAYLHNHASRLRRPGVSGNGRCLTKKSPPNLISTHRHRRIAHCIQESEHPKRSPENQTKKPYQSITLLPERPHSLSSSNFPIIHTPSRSRTINASARTPTCAPASTQTRPPCHSKTQQGHRSTGQRTHCFLE